MTRLAVITDVHADVHTLRDALVQIARLGCELVVCAGDLVDYGRFPEETISLLRDAKIPCIRGNHDRWALREGRDQSGRELTTDSLRFLESLTLSWSKTIDGVRVVAWHARPRSDMAGVYSDATRGELDAMVDRAEADVLIVGHTHLPLCLDAGAGRLVVNPGALLRDPAQPMDAKAMVFDPTLGRFVPGDGPEGGTFGVLELPSRRFTIHRAADGAEVEISRAATERGTP